MSISIAGTKRDRGLLQVHVHLDDDAKECQLEAAAKTRDGEEVPVRVRPTEEEGEWLLVVPALTVTQELALKAVSWEGSTVEELAHRLNPITTRLGTPARPLRRGARAASLDVWPEQGSGEWDVALDRMIRTPEGIDICHGHAELICAGRQDVEGEVRIRPLDAKGHELNHGEWVCLSDTVKPHPDHPGFFVRLVEFSLRVPAYATIIVLWVQPSASATALPTGLACLDPRETAALREAWKAITTSAAHDDAYDAWYRSVHAASPAELAMQRADQFDRDLMFSVVQVLRTVSPEVLRASVDSVLAQSYEHFELVLVNAAPENRRLATAVRSLELADARVRSVPLGADFGVAAATSEGVDAAVGDFVCLLEEEDQLAPEALYRLAEAAQADPELDLVYADEDRLVRGRYVSPQLKPDWDHDLLLSTNYLGHAVAIRLSVLREMETMGRELDGAHTYYLALYAAERARSICHVPYVLYHALGSEGGRNGAGVASTAAEIVALRAHLAATDPTATVRISSRVSNGHEVTYEIADEPLVSVIILNRDNIPALDRCLTSLRALTDYPRYEVIVVEHDSVEAATFEYYRRAEAADKRVRTIYFQGDGTFDEARVAMFGASRAEGSYLLFLGHAVEVTEGGWMRRMLSLCMREDTAAVGARLLRPDGTVESCGAHLSTTGVVATGRYLDADDGGYLNLLHLMHGVTALSGACMMVDAAAFAQVGGFSERFPTWLGDADLCLRLLGQGYRVVVDPQVTLTHHRALTGLDPREHSVQGVKAVGRLWEDWPYGERVYDSTLNPNLDERSPYHVLGLLSL